ncbi:PEP/pyruvate-binding domain-containing protein [Leeia aquatica]|uniref:Phosphoenolpyruvate synthase n=1 Tax=Leeia aquatica TaxID=2725557 RepID=A0A847S2A2_9NEIS|nr:PEP/pyruvate-binding domain-containing protein [Leeia aquatica]NLR73864.1 hypothetical protein [Leeia aquatica]
MLIDWPETFTRGPAETGGKAWQLSRLHRYGFPVTEGRVLPAQAYRDWVAAGRPALRDHPAAWDWLWQLPAHWRQRSLAIRSSALAEDGPEHSFAGIHHTTLGAVGIEAILSGIEAVFRSVDSPQAVAYREHFQIDAASVAMAVVIMPLLTANSAGVCFTCNPQQGRRDQVLIQATLGLGEALVSGATEPDEALLTYDSNQQLQQDYYRIGRKQVQTHSSLHGPVETRSSEQAASMRALSEQQVQQLAACCIEAAYALDDTQTAWDIEWAWQANQLYLLQARPVTRLGEALPAALANQTGFWSNANTKDVIPHQLSPLDSSVMGIMVNRMLTVTGKLLQYPFHPGAVRTRLLNGRAYLHLSLLQWEFHDGFGFAPASTNQLAGGTQPEITVPPLSKQHKRLVLRRMLRITPSMMRLRRKANKLHADALEEARNWLPAGWAQWENQQLAQEIDRLYRHVWQQEELQRLQTGSGVTYTLLLGKLSQRMPRAEAQQLLSGLLADQPSSITMQQNLQLMDVARLARQHADVVSWLRSPERDQQPWDTTWAADHPFRMAFADFLKTYGHRAIYESDSTQPRWAENPAYLLDCLAGWLDVDFDTLAVHRKQRAEAARRALRSKLPWYRRLLLPGMLKQSALEFSQREQARSSLVSYILPQRRMLLEAGRRLQQAGELAAPEHIFWLVREEIPLALSGARAGRWAALVADRQLQRQHWEHNPAPDVVFYGTTQPVSTPAATEVAPSDVLKGLPVSNGRVQGKVRRLRHPSEGTRLATGEILLAPSTDPGWTPLFLKAAGLILETGGYLSHGAIVAREFGLPAVVNITHAMTLLQDGDEVELCGDTGEVRRLAPQA